MLPAYEYSNLDYWVHGRWCRTGQPYELYIQKHVIDRSTCSAAEALGLAQTAARRRRWSPPSAAQHVGGVLVGGQERFEGQFGDRDVSSGGERREGVMRRRSRSAEASSNGTANPSTSTSSGRGGT